MFENNAAGNVYTQGYTCGQCGVWVSTNTSGTVGHQCGLMGVQPWPRPYTHTVAAAPMGWQCPRCARCYSPQHAQCLWCQPKAEATPEPPKAD